MRQVTKIEMATSNDVYNVVLGDTVEIKKENDGFSIYILDDEVECCLTHKQAKINAKGWVIDSDLVISGYGSNSGRKFWQAPDKIQKDVLRLASK